MNKSPTPGRADDLRNLEILHLLNVEQQSSGAVAKRMGLSRNAVLGVQFRTSEQCAKHPCACRRKANRDGGMPARWWART
ncbi:hypothetical protein [Puniceibacterium confluentis]|uniref:hypothetical protein n=1 Tax=Puniceibacterium confluentis TaxID=1958944 RepID=UPI0011B67806|nr:hypothetical protein [Puniceibacterium confluentis]